MHKINIGTLKYFLAVCEERHFTRRRYAEYRNRHCRSLYSGWSTDLVAFCSSVRRTA